MRIKHPIVKNKNFVPTTSRWSNYPSPLMLLAEVKNDELKELRNFKEASTNMEWVKAMSEEIDILQENNTWVLEGK